jgi:hypothetical protein
MDLAVPAAARDGRARVVAAAAEQAMAANPAASILQTRRVKPALAAGLVPAEGRGAAAAMVPDITRRRQQKSFEICLPPAQVPAARVR